jgi:hypothetical protein
MPAADAATPASEAVITQPAPRPQRAVATRPAAPAAKAAPESAPIPVATTESAQDQFVDEAVGDGDAADASAPAAAPPPAPLPAASAAASPQRARATVSRAGSEAESEAGASADSIALIPVEHDARLDRAAWLERIRARRDGGAIDAARASLRRFVREHPHVRLPDDLRALLAPAP